MEGFEYDVYDYFGELEYGSDSYWDARMKHLDPSAGVGENEKKKRKKSAVEEDAEDRVETKRRKDGGGGVREVGDNVLYVPFEARLAPPPPGIQSTEGRFALLPDWKERFPERRGGDESPVGKRKQMPAEMRRAAEEVVGDEDEEDGSAGRDDEDDEGMGDDGDSEEDDEEEDEAGENAGGVDHNLVMQVLRQKLADSGLGDVDESMFKDVIAKMMSGDGDSEDAVGGLASLLLGQEGGGGKAFEGFLAGQGVELGNAEEDHDDKDESEGDDNDTGSRTTNEPQAKPTRKTSRNPATTTTGSSSSSSSSKVGPSKTPPTSRARSKRSQTATLQSPSPTRTSPIVVPSPPGSAVAAIQQPSRKRKAPSLDEPSIPEPPQIASTATSNAKPPPAKRKRATPGSRAEQPPAADVREPAPTRGRTTRSAAATAGGKGRR